MITGWKYIKMENNITKILGFHAGHDASYSILENGIPIIHEELERITREKEIPGDGIKLALSSSNLEDIKYLTSGNTIPSPYGGRHRYLKENQIVFDAYFSRDSFLEINKILEKNEGKFYQLGHHKSHAANAFFSSNFNEALIVTIDGGGTEDTEPIIRSAFTIWEGKDNKIQNLDIIPINRLCLGTLWDHVLESNLFKLSSGHPKGNQAGTLMAMATMGEPKDEYVNTIYKASTEPGSYTKNLLKLLSEEQPSEYQYDIAASLQKVTEKIVKENIEKYLGNSQYLCLAGGTVLNSVMVGKMYDWWPQLKGIYVYPTPYDAGLAIGSAQYLWHHILDNPRIKWDNNISPYLGRKYTINKNDIMDENLNVEENVKDEDVIKLLCDQNIVCVFGGGSESGRRALGNRSILADPRSKEMKDLINDKVKHRQWFRPFAPSILREEVKNWFEKDIDSPYMSFVVKFKEEVRDKVPAVVHFDGSGRLQTVTENDNKWYYNFISKFKDETGVPILLNTSFNDREPIVETPEDAIKCFKGTNIDYLYFYEYGILINKK